MPDHRRESPAALRNREPILAVLGERLPARARVLEVGSGTGQHAAFFARMLPGVAWQPTDCDDALFASVEAWARAEGVASPLAPFVLDVTGEVWPAGPFDAVFSANMIHIAPWETCQGLIAGASRCLAPGGLLLLYGPFRVAGRHTSKSNAAFDADLRARDPRWGVRDLEAVVGEAKGRGLVLVERSPMPANNQILSFSRQG